MAFLQSMYHNKPNITYLLITSFFYSLKKDAARKGQKHALSFKYSAVPL